MHIVIIVLTVIISILIIGIVLIQKSKGGGLSSQFGGAGTVMGVRQTNSFLEKGTWTLIGLLVVLSNVSVWVAPDRNNGTNLRAVPEENTVPTATLPAAGQLDVTPVAVPAASEAPVQATEETPAAAPEE